jgi:1-aminocyclopropane-1-carboxylate deaminase/D-cysteine desulfhydrase-like pyridoxal-dependent ACC family enzyme
MNNGININEISPIEEHGGYMVKRDDSFSINGGRGGKVRTCWILAQGSKGLVTAGSRSSPQVNIVAQIAKVMGIPCRAHTPMGELSSEVIMAKEAGADIIQHPYGYNNVIIKRARDDAEEKGYTNIPFGMQHIEAVNQTEKQVENIPNNVKRIVVPVGSGMSLSGILHGLLKFDKKIPVLGIMVGADPIKRLDEYAPDNWRDMVKLERSELKYAKEATITKLGNLQLDPIYEAKCLPYLEKDDLFWIVGIRGSL